MCTSTNRQNGRSINLVVSLTDKMRQSDDPEFAAALRRIRFNYISIEGVALSVAPGFTRPKSITESNPLLVRRHVMLKLDITGHLMAMSLNSRSKILKTN